ncbi:protein PIN-LIKES 5-like isoform X2 [Ananas comosus]|uniref:Protein PIN-LIKES 5-like isoform X2 n=1 Tax=Ananas comosus TaxID=4615 RepID=A0A6P5ESK9_ANACO|nr:protein PIN-LIKES 5-like isoform X2 [Ananas comosus]
MQGNTLILFAVFGPALVFASLAKTVTLEEIISWWFMPVNIGITFLIGGILGWIVVKILRPEKYLEKIIIASCSAGNLGNLPLIIIPAICNEEGNPFGEPSTCNSNGLSYVSFSMALGGIFIWTHTYDLMHKSAQLYDKIQNESRLSKTIDEKSEESGNAHFNIRETEASCSDQDALLSPSSKPVQKDAEQPMIVPFLSRRKMRSCMSNNWERFKEITGGTIHQIAEELLTPPMIAAIFGFFVGTIPQLKFLIIGDDAPLRVLQSSITLLGDATLPCVTLLLGANLTRGIRKSVLKPLAILAIITVRYVILPLFGIGIITTAAKLGFLPKSPLYHYVLLIQFALPPAMSIGTMAELFDVGQEECSVIFLWTYLTAALAFTIWSTIFMWILT